MSLQRIALPLLLLLALLAHLPSSPAFRPVPFRDEGQYAYISQVMYEGDLPYRDAWECKPPLIYMIGEAGLHLTGGSFWGIWLMGLISLSTAALLGYWVMKREFGPWPALFGSIIWLISLTLLEEHGNYNEQYALSLHFAALALFLLLLRSTGWRLGFALGMIFGLLSALRPNLMGVGFSIGLFTILCGLQRNRWRLGMARLAAMGTGGALIWALIYGWASYHGIWADLWDQSFGWNSRYIQVELIQRIRNFLSGIELFSKSGLFMFALVAWIAGIGTWIQHHRQGLSFNRLYALCLLDLPIQWSLACLSPYPASHYYIIWLPTMAVISAAWFGYLAQLVSMVTPTATGRSLIRVFTCALIVASCLLPLRVLSWRLQKYQPNYTHPLVSYIQSHTQPSDTVLLWGAEAHFNFLSNRRSPSQMCAQYPLFYVGYTNGDKIRTFMQELQSHQPVLIIDTFNRSQPPLDPVRRSQWSWQNSDSIMRAPPLQEMDLFFTYVTNHYERVTRIDSYDVYQLKKNQRSITLTEITGIPTPWTPAFGAMYVTEGHAAPFENHSWSKN